MSSRKQTPDVLGAILGGAEPVAAIPEPAANPARTPRPRKPVKAESAAGAEAVLPASSVLPAPEPAIPTNPFVPTIPVITTVEWEYLEVVFRDYRGWRPRAVNGRESSNWKNAPGLVDYLKQLGDEGWELVSMSNPYHNEKEAYFKRPK